jgi:hypothetical protein
MDLRDDMPTNLADLSDQLHQIAARADQPAPAVWEEIRQRLEDLGTFLDTFVIPRIAAPTRYLQLAAFEHPVAHRPPPELISIVAGHNGDDPDAA